MENQLDELQKRRTMRGRKLTSMLATMVATGLIGIAALGAGSASADVLCQDVNLSYNCPTEETWGVGSEFEAVSLKKATLKWGTSGSLVLATCYNYQLAWTVTNAGGYYNTAYPEVDANNMSISNCEGDDSMSVINDGGGKITQLSLGSPSQQGYFYPSGLEIEVHTNWLGENYPAVCTYKIVGPGKIEGAKTVEYSSETKLVFNEALVERLTAKGPGCGEKARFSATYGFNNYPEGIYVLPQ